MDSISEFVKTYSGYGYGDGSGSGNGSGFGNGSGSGYGDGEGYGYGLKSYHKHTVYYIDYIPTLIEHVHGNVAIGYIINSDLTLRKCYVVKNGNLFAHGETLHKAMKALRDKMFEDMPEDERIDAFIAKHDKDRKYTTDDYYDWHHRLTGSCEMGRNEWIAGNGIDMSKPLTPLEFCELCKDAYGGDVIKKVMRRYE